MDPNNEYIIRADVTGREISPVDVSFMLAMFAKPHITIIIKGAHEGLSPTLWNWEYLRRRCGSIMYTKYKRFIRESPGMPYKADGWTSMSLEDYGRYLDARRAALAAYKGPQTEEPKLNQDNHSEDPNPESSGGPSSDPSSEPSEPMQCEPTPLGASQSNGFDAPPHTGSVLQTGSNPTPQVGDKRKAEELSQEVPQQASTFPSETGSMPVPPQIPSEAFSDGHPIADTFPNATAQAMPNASTLDTALPNPPMPTAGTQPEEPVILQITGAPEGVVWVSRGGQGRGISNLKSPSCR